MNRRRWMAGAAGLALLVGLAAAPPVQQSEAAFIDSEYGGGTFHAATLATPEVESCVARSLLGTFTGFTITWSSAHDMGFQRLTIQGVEVPHGNISQEGNGPWVYSSTMSAGLLGTLLTGGLLGATNSVQIYTATGTNWRSPTRATRTLSIGGLLGLGGDNTCS